MVVQQKKIENNNDVLSPLIDIENTKYTRNNKGEIDNIYELGKWYRFKTKDGVKFYKYLGVFYNKKDVPIENCIYVIGNGLFMRNIDYNKFINSSLFNEGLQKSKNGIKLDKDDQLLPTNPTDDDNLLLLMLKLLMKDRHLTENGFKKLFDSTSEMNNMKRLIFNGNGLLSWGKFITMTEKLNADVVISILDRDDNQKVIATNDNTSKLN